MPPGGAVAIDQTYGPAGAGNQGCGVEVRVGMTLPMSVSDGAGRMSAWAQVRAVALAVEKITLRYRSATKPAVQARHRVALLGTAKQPVSDPHQYSGGGSAIGSALCSRLLGGARSCSLLLDYDLGLWQKPQAGQWW